jgi:hypothetical protein
VQARQLDEHLLQIPPESEFPITHPVQLVELVQVSHRGAHWAIWLLAVVNDPLLVLEDTQAPDLSEYPAEQLVHAVAEHSSQSGVIVVQAVGAPFTTVKLKSATVHALAEVQESQLAAQSIQLLLESIYCPYSHPQFKPSQIWSPGQVAGC